MERRVLSGWPSADVGQLRTLRGQDTDGVSGALRLEDPWAPDVWRLRALPIDRTARIGRVGALDWRAIDPPWLRGLCKRWAQHRLRQGLSAGHARRSAWRSWPSSGSASGPTGRWIRRPA